MEAVQRIVALSDDQLVDAVTTLATSERRAIGLLVASLAELDARRLYLDLGYSSLFDYCTRALHLSEQAAYVRIEAARASRRFPVIIERIIEGALSLTAARLLAPHLTEDNQSEVIEEARYKRTREVEAIVARRRPLPPVASPADHTQRRRASQAARGAGGVAPCDSEWRSCGHCRACARRASSAASSCEVRFDIDASSKRRAGPKEQTHSVGGEAGCLDARRSALRIRGGGRTAVRGARVPRIPPRQGLREGGSRDAGQHRASLPRTQRTRGGVGIRRDQESVSGIPRAPLGPWASPPRTRPRLLGARRRRSRRCRD